MIKRRVRFTCAALLLAFLYTFTTASAQETVKRRYEVFTSADGGGRIATVETSVSEELVSVAINRKDKPTHHYRAYLPVKVTDASIGSQPLFAVYHNDEVVQTNIFNHKLSEVNGPQRRKAPELAIVRRESGDDMRILRAVRGFDPDSCVILAELDYVIVTYDASIFEGAPADNLRISDATGALAQVNKTGRANFVSMKLKAARSQNDTLDGCISGADTRFTQCRTDPAIADKSICYNNRSREIQVCYATYGPKAAKEPPPKN